MSLCTSFWVVPECIALTCIFVGPKEQRWRVGVDQKLHVVQGKLLNVVPEMVFLIHALEEGQGSGPHLKYIKDTTTEETNVR